MHIYPVIHTSCSNQLAIQCITLILWCSWQKRHLHPPHIHNLTIPRCYTSHQKIVLFANRGSTVLICTMIELAARQITAEGYYSYIHFRAWSHCYNCLICTSSPRGLLLERKEVGKRESIAERGARVHIYTDRDKTGVLNFLLWATTNILHDASTF